MLYIQFATQDEKATIAFQKLYDYLTANHYQDYVMREYEDDIDLEERLQERALVNYKTYFPEYAQAYLEKYFEATDGTYYSKEESLTGLFSYLDVDFEVEFTNLTFEDGFGTITFAARSYPYGGLDRFLMVLKAFGFEPVECYNGFDVFEFQWESEYDYSANVLPEKTKAYRNKHSID